MSLEPIHLCDLRLLSCYYNSPNMENPIFDNDACDVLSQTHHRLATSASKENKTVNTNEACLDISEFVPDIVNKKLSHLSFEILLAEQVQTKVHVFDDATSGTCRCKSGHEMPSTIVFPKKNQVLVYRDFSLTYFYSSILSISKNADSFNTYTVIIDFTEQKHPRLLPLFNLCTLLSKPSATSQAVYANCLGLYNDSGEPKAPANEFVFVTNDRTSTTKMARAEKWKTVRENHNEWECYASKAEPHIRRIVVPCYNEKPAISFLVIQYDARNTLNDLFINASEVKKTVSPAYPKELLMLPSSCTMLINEALLQNKVLSLSVANLIEAEIIAAQKSEHIGVIDGRWTYNDLLDGEIWRNSGSSKQKEVIPGTTQPLTVTTYIPKSRKGDKENTAPLVKKEHIIINDFTIVYYHTHIFKTKTHPKPRKSTKTIGLVNENAFRRLLQNNEPSPPNILLPVNDIITID